MESNDLDDSLFEVGLELDGLGLTEIRERARVLRGKVRPERRLAYSMTVWRALLEVGTLSRDECYAKLSAWCEGFDIAEVDVVRAVDARRLH